MKKILLLIVLLLLPVSVHCLEYPKLHYKNAIVYDLTDSKILYELKSEDKTSIASLTKIMTIITALENVEDDTKIIEYTQDIRAKVPSGTSNAGFKLGDKLTFNDLLYGAMLPSGADASTTLAIYTTGDLKSFIEKMNKLAKEIGMTKSHFANVHGLDKKDHYSTAKDISILLEYALKNEKFKEIYTTKEYKLSNGKEISSTVKRYSEYIDTSKIIGSKTGFTQGAGLAISVLMKHENHEIIFVTIGAPTTGESYNVLDAVNLIYFIENNYSNHEIIKENSVIKKIPVEYSKTKELTIKTESKEYKFLPNDYNKEDIKITYEGLEILSYKNEKNSKVGTVTYKYKDEIIKQYDVYVKDKLEKDNKEFIKTYKKEIIIISIISTISIILFIIIYKKVIHK